MRALLAVKTSYKQTRIIFSGKKFKRGGVVKGMNVVLSGKVDGMRSLERVLQLDTPSVKCDDINKCKNTYKIFHDISNLVT